MRKSLKALLIALVVSLSLGVITACKKTEEPKKTKLDSPVIASKTYTGSNQKATVAENEAYEVTVNEGGINVGEYDVVLTLTDTKKYEWTTPDADDKTKVTLKFAITKASNEITVLTVADRTYGEQADEPTATAKFGTPEFTYATSENGEYTATVPSAVGKYWVKATVEGTTNYDGAIKTAQFEIKKAASAITTAPAAKTLTYTGSAQELVTAGAANGGTLNYKLGDGEWGTTIPTAADAGDYKVYYKVVGDGSHSDTAETEISVTIAQATNEITGMVLAGWTYGETANEPTATAKFGTATFTYATSENGTYTETKPTDAGDYWVKATVAETKNYAGATQTLKFTIAKAHSAITSNPAANQLTYNGEAQALVTAGESADGTLQYKLGADGEWSENIPIATNAGEYVVYFRLKGDKNHIDIESNLSVVNVTIAKAAATVTAPTAKTELVYNGNAQALASAGSVSDATLEYKLGDGEWGADVPAATNVGEYTVYYRVTVDNNHTGATEGSFKVVIAKAANEVTFSLDGEEIHCGDAVPTEFNATSVAGAITYTYSIDNVNFYPIDGLGEDFKFEAGKTYYVKATAAESENYLSAYKVASIVATHKFGEGVENDGIVTATCACGHKQVTGERTTNSTVDFAATVGEDGTVSATAGELDISAVYSESAEGVKLTVNETEYNAAVVNGKITLKGVIPVTVYGNVKLGIKFSQDTVDYDFVAPALIITKTVSDKATLQSVKIYADSETMQGGGYYRLGANVNVGYWYLRDNAADYRIGTEYPFKGTIDGNGYAVDKLLLSGIEGGFVQRMDGGTIKNIAFTDFTLSSGSGLTYEGTGIFENVYIKLSKVGIAAYSNYYNIVSGGWGGNYTTIFFAKSNTPAQVTMKNIVVDYNETYNVTSTDIDKYFWGDATFTRALFGNIDKSSSLTNVALIGANNSKVGTTTQYDSSGMRFNIVCDAAWSWNNGAKAGIYVYYADDGSTNGVALPSSGWDVDFWSGAEGGMPTFKGMTAYSKSAEFTKSASSVEVGASAEFAVPANCLLYLGENTPEGVTLENGVITVDESVAIGTTFTVCSKNIFDVANPVEITVTVSKKTVKFALETTTEVDLNAAADGGVVTVAGDDKTIDLTTVYNETSEAELTLNGVSLGTATINGGVLSFNTSVIPVSGTYGNVELKVKIEGEATDCEITVPMLVITKTISDKATLQSLKNYADSATMQGGGYYRLGADVEAGEWYTSYGASQEAAKDYRFGVTYAFKGTFDGNGYAIKKLVLTVPKSGYASGFIHKIDGGIIKNVAFTDLALGSDESLVYCGNGTFENIYVRYSAVTGFASNGTGTAPSSGWASVLCGPFFTSTENDKFSHAILTNVVIDLSVISDAAWAAGRSQCIIGAFDNLSVMNNVAVIGMKKDFRSGNKGKLVRSEMGYLDYVGLGGGNTPYYAYLRYSDGTEETGDKFAAFPATGWTDNYWTVDAANKSITWKTK